MSESPDAFVVELTRSTTSGRSACGGTRTIALAIVAEAAIPGGQPRPTPWFTSWALSRSRPRGALLHACCVHEPPVDDGQPVIISCVLLTMLGCSFLCGNQTQVPHAIDATSSP